MLQLYEECRLKLARVGDRQRIWPCYPKQADFEPCRPKLPLLDATYYPRVSYEKLRFKLYCGCKKPEKSHHEAGFSSGGARMSRPTGRKLPLSLFRRLAGDLAYFSQRVPLVPVQRRMHIAGVSEARQQAQPRPSWTAIFAKAYAFVTAARPELRRSYLTFPWPHLFEHAANVASISTERELGEERGILPGRVENPERLSLADLDARLRLLQEQPLETEETFRSALSVSRMIKPLRRVWWWWQLAVSGSGRERYLGTFGIESYAGLGACPMEVLTPLTSALAFGPIGADGWIDVRLSYDHRVLDGATVARSLQNLEQVLNCEILSELRYLRAIEAA